VSISDFCAVLLTDALGRIIALSLTVSLSATALATLFGTPFGACLAIYAVPGRRILVIMVNALLGLPPVVVGLALYLLLSRSGPLGVLGLLFTPGTMVAAQALLALPIGTRAALLAPISPSGLVRATGFRCGGRWVVSCSTRRAPGPVA
jgi:tungstate transport system permease protein